MSEDTVTDSTLTDSTLTDSTLTDSTLTDGTLTEGTFGGDSHAGAALTGPGSTGSVSMGDSPARVPAKGADLLVEEGDAAGDYLERLLDILDFDGDIDLDVEGERAVVSVVGGSDLDKLVGDKGAVLDALQELVRLAAAQETGVRSRLMLDIGGYRAQRRQELTALGQQAAEQAASSGQPVRLAAMNPFERKVVHDAVGTVAGARSSSEGEEPRRYVVVTAVSS